MNGISVPGKAHLLRRHYVFIIIYVEIKILFGIIKYEKVGRPILSHQGRLPMDSEFLYELFKGSTVCYFVRKYNIKIMNPNLLGKNI
jgi:hypothetical protein